MTCHRAWQVCLAYRNDGGTTVVVLSHRPKLSMEQQFQSIIPPSQRFGTRFVFRQVWSRTQLLAGWV